MEFKSQSNYEWNQLEDTVLYTTYEAFLFHNYSFYFRMMKKVIDSLIPGGIMNYLVDNYYTRKWKFKKVEEGPKTLNIEDLWFGFNIWIGFCFISFVAFLAEQVSRFKKNSRKFKFAKVYSLKTDRIEAYEKDITKLNEIFRVT